MEICDLGIIEYKDALEFQKKLVLKRINKTVPDTLIVMEHYPVITLGRGAGQESLVDRRYFKNAGTPVIETGRGGSVTYHAPGQLVLYPVIDLSEKKQDISFYIDFLEKTVSRVLNRLGVSCGRKENTRGVWASSGKKIAFIGIGIKRWVTFHGVSININNDITPFSHMDPCGESWIKVTSAKEVVGYEVNMRRAKNIFIDQFERDLEKEYSQYCKTAGAI